MPQRKPLVAIVPDIRAEHPGAFVPLNYLEMLQAAGALPVILPFATDARDIAELAALFDGYLLSGGADVDPRTYGEPVLTHCGELQPLRDAFELALVPHIVAAEKPVLAICRGMQALNVALGGTLFQDIDALYPREIDLQHNQRADSAACTHAVTVGAGSLLAAIVGAGELGTNTHHHQAVHRLAQDLRACAWAADGVIEAFEWPGKRFILGVQWHPECTGEADAASAKIFAAFVRACSDEEVFE